MSFTTESADLYPTNKILLSKQWFDYTPEMNSILNVLDQRIFNLEIALQANNQISNRSHITVDNNLSSKIIKQNQFSQELVRNSIDNLSQRSAHISLISDQHSSNSTLEKQVYKLNLSSHISSEQITIDNIDPSNNSLLSDTSKVILPSINQMKSRAYEFTAIFENAFDQLNIIHNGLSRNNLNNNQLQLDDIDLNNNCNPFALNIAGIFIMNENDKFRYEIEYFLNILLLLFRSLLLDSQIDFQNSINNTHNHFSSKELIDLNNRLKNSQDKISNLSFIKKHFHTEKSQQLNRINSIKSQLKDHLMEEKSRSKIALHYSNDWKKNHILQWIQMLFKIEQDYIKTIHQYENILKQTEITHQETIKILIKQKNQMKLNANKWYDYYQNETSHFERELTNFRYEFNQINKQKQDLYEDYQRMKIIVDEYNQMKLNEKLVLEKQKQHEEAIKRIQAWWRGIIIRQIKQKKRKKKKKK